MVYKSLRTYSSDSTFLPIWFHMSLPSFSLAEIFESKNPYLFSHKHHTMITLHKSNHNSLTVMKYPAPIHMSLKVSTMSFFTVSLPEWGSPHAPHTALFGGVHLCLPLNTWNGTRTDRFIWRRNKWTEECKWHQVSQESNGFLTPYIHSLSSAQYISEIIQTPICSDTG